MKLHSIESGDIKQVDLDALHLTEKVIALLPQGKFKVNCHTLSRVMAKLTHGKCEDGYFFGRGWQHSWVRLPSRNLLDCYPIAASNPFIVVDELRYCLTAWGAAAWLKPWLGVQLVSAELATVARHQRPNYT